MTVFTLRVHIARLLTKTTDHIPYLTTADPLHPVHLLLLCGTTLTRALLQQWNRNLNCRYASHWRDTTNLCSPTAQLILCFGYLLMCLPCAAIAVYYVVYRPQHPDDFPTHFHTNTLMLYVGLIALLSLLLLRAYAYTLYAHHFFSSLENNVAYNVHTASVSFFKQYGAFSMKRYAARVPLVTITRAFINHITLTTLTYTILPHSPALLIPSACEAIDTLRGKKTSTLFINIIVIIRPPLAAPDSLRGLFTFFEASGLQAFLSPDDGLLVCAWGSVPATTYDTAGFMLPLLFQFPHAICNQNIYDDEIHAPDSEATHHTNSPLKRPPKKPLSLLQRMVIRFFAIRGHYYYRELASPDNSFLLS